jgi:cysteine desulfurase/selenocysteine lyase
MGEAIDYLREVGPARIAAHEQELLAYATERLEAIDGLTIIGKASDKAGVISFVIDGAHPHDMGTIMDQEGVAIRAGHHCAQPVMEHFGLAATARASFGLYSTREDVDALVRGIDKVKELFG